MGQPLRGAQQRIFPKRRRKAKNEIKPHTKLHGNSNGTRKTKAYLHRFKIIEDPTCTCGKAVQTTDHLIFECETLTKEREKLKTTALKKDKWPINKKELIRKCYKQFVKFINDIPFDILTQNNNIE